MSSSRDLASRSCIPCRGGVPALRGQAISTFLADLDPGWRVVSEHHLEKEYAFPDFRKALDFAVRIGELAETEGHHPDIHLSWGRVTLRIWTHKIDGLTENDFILAAKADRVC
jgi:4a-hydroxytetrahydrobiopterin dehydratase